MAKKTNKIEFKGVLEVLDEFPYLQITEIEKTKNDERLVTYDLIKELKEFDSCEVSFNVTDTKKLEPIEE